MKTRLGVLAFGVAVVAAVGVVPAEAATTSVKGTGSYEKLVVNNAAKKLTFKIHAPGGACDIQYLAVKFRDRDGTRYAMDGGCYQAKWAASLSRGTKLVSCDGLRLRYSAKNSVWTGSVPRTCLKQLGSAVKVTESYVQDYSPNINKVPATKYVRQG